MMQNKILKKALQYRKRGWSIIPVGKNKKPLISWRKYTTVKPSSKQIKRWWRDYPSANIAIVTGKISDLTVVDIEKGGSIQNYPATKAVKTGGGGYHFYYKYTERFKNCVRIKELTDIRNDGGYVLAPPSLHQSGLHYKWEAKMKAVAFPAHLFLKEESSSKTETLSSKFEGVGEGERNSKAASVCGTLLKMVPYKYKEDIVWPAMKDWNDKNTPPMPEDELRSVYESIIDRASFVEDEEDKEVYTLDSLSKVHKQETLARKTGDKHLVPTGITAIDAKLNGGFRKGDLIYVGARPSVGKTAFALSLAYNAASAKKRVLFFSLEMYAVDLYDRLLSFATGRPCSEFITATVPHDELVKGYAKLKKLGIQISELSKASSRTIENIIQERVVRSKIDLIILDYIELLKDQTKESERIRITTISHALKAIAKSTGIPTLVLSQVNRKSDGKNPKMSDLKESGALEADADTIMLLHRMTDVDFNRDASLEVAKNRKGETGIIKLNFNPKTTRFSQSKKKN